MSPEQKKEAEFFAKKIRALRMRSRLRREQIADILDMPIGQYINHEEGTVPVTEDLVEDTCNFYYGTNKKDLLPPSGGEGGKLLNFPGVDKSPA